MIGNADMGKILCDSGANINLMPLYVAKRLNLGELTHTAMTLHVTTPKLDLTLLEDLNRNPGTLG